MIDAETRFARYLGRRWVCETPPSDLCGGLYPVRPFEELRQRGQEVQLVLKREEDEQVEILFFPAQDPHEHG